MHDMENKKPQGQTTIVILTLADVFSATDQSF
jgi:hypothetical protein